MKRILPNVRPTLTDEQKASCPDLWKRYRDSVYSVEDGSGRHRRIKMDKETAKRIATNVRRIAIKLLEDKSLHL